MDQSLFDKAYGYASEVFDYNTIELKSKVVEGDEVANSDLIWVKDDLIKPLLTDNFFCLFGPSWNSMFDDDDERYRDRYTIAPLEYLVAAYQFPDDCKIVQFIKTHVPKLIKDLECYKVSGND